MDTPVFILGSHKSGTSLLRNLLDGLPDAFVIPIETHFFQFAGFGVSYAPRSEPPRTLSFGELVARLSDHVSLTNLGLGGRTHTGDNRLEGCWDPDRFQAYLLGEAAVPFAERAWPDVMNAYVRAIHVGLYGVPPTSKRFVEKSVEHSEFAPLLLKMYPDARFVHIVRNPYATMVAMRRHATRRGFPFLGRIVTGLKASHDHLYLNRHLIDQYLVIRYEDLIAETEQTMRRVAAHCDFPFHEGMLRPTSAGDAWAGNSTSGSTFAGISSAPLTHWKGAITNLEIAAINVFGRHVCADFGYPVKPDPRLTIWPERGESLRVFVANRVLIRMLSLNAGSENRV